MKRIGQIIISLILSVCIAMSNIVLVSAASIGQVKSLKAKTVTYNSVTLSWKKVRGVTGYEIQQYSKKKWKTLKKDNKKTTYTVKKLKTGTKYKFRVRAYKKSGKKNTYGKYSKTLSVTAVPSKVKAKVSSVTVNSAKLSWSKVSGASGYYVQKKNGKKWKTVATLKSKSKSYTVKKLALGKTYSYRVMAYRTVGKKKIKGTASSTLTVKPAVPQPKNVKLSDVKPDSAVISWSKAAGAEGYRVQKKDDGSWITVANVKDKTEVTVTIAPNEESEFRVRAYKGKYYSSASSTVKALYSINAAEELDVASVDEDSAILTWMAADKAAGYEVQLLEKGEWTTVATVTDTNYELSCEPGKEYEIRVVSFVTVDGKDYFASPSNTVEVKIEEKAEEPSTTQADLTTKPSEDEKPSTTKPTTTRPTTKPSVTESTTGPSVTEPTTKPAAEPTTVPTATVPSTEPVTEPTTVPTATVPSTEPTTVPVSEPTTKPTTQPTTKPTTQPTTKPTTQPTTQKPAAAPTVNAVRSLKASISDGKIKLTWSAPSGGATGYEAQILKAGNWETFADVTARTASVTVEPNVEHQLRVISYKKVNGEKYYGEPVTVNGIYTVPKLTSFSLSTTTNTKEGAKLSWSKISGVSGYEVRRLDGSAWVPVHTTEGTSATVPLVPGVRTYFCVAAYVTYNSNKYYGSPASEKYTTFTVTKPGSALTKGTETKDGVFLKWTSVKNIDGYEVQRQEGSSWVKVITSATNSCTAPLVPNIDNVLRVVSYVTIDGVNYYSASTETKTAKYTLGSVSNLKSGAITKSSAELTWTAAKDAYAYEVQMLEGSAWKPVDTVYTTDAEVSIVPGVTYKFRVVPVADFNGKDYKGGASNDISVTYTVPPVFALKVTDSDDTSVTLSWTASAAAEGYIVYKDAEIIATLDSTETTIKIEGLEKATAYPFNVKAIQTVDGIDYYSSSSTTVTGKTTPDKVTGLKCKKEGQSTVTLEWNKENVADAYNIYVKNASGEWEAVGETSSCTYTVTNLGTDKEYEFSVDAFHKVNGKSVRGDLSDPISARTTFSTIENLKAGEVNSSILRISWLKVDDAFYESYYRKDADSDFKQVNSGNPNSSIFFLPLNEDADIDFKVTDTKNCMVTVTWKPVKGASKYAVQSKLKSKDIWTTVETTTSNTASFIVTPETEYDLRLVAFDGSFKVRAGKKYENDEVKYTLYEQLDNVPGTISKRIEGLYVETPEFNPADNAAKTAYVLKVVKAINDTKAEKNIEKVTKTEVVESVVDSLKVKFWLTLGIWVDLSTILSDEQLNELAGLEEELNTNKSYNGSVSDGYYSYTASDGKSARVPLSSFVSPYKKEAYLYNAADVNSINSKITGITYSKSGTKEIIELTLAQEVATKDNDVTPVHEGLYEDYSGTAGTPGMDDGRVTVGPTKIRVTINENGTLDDMKISTNFEMYSQMTMEGISFRMNVRATKVEDTYTFTR